MKAKRSQGHTSKRHYQNIFVLIAALLFFPIAQAAHISQHQGITGDFDCQICHTNTDIEGNAAGKTSLFTLQNTPLDPVNVRFELTPNSQIGHHFAIRAPPVH